MKGVKFNNIGYRDIPKCACTSIKRYFYTVKTGDIFSPIKEGVFVHEYFDKKEISDAEYRLVVIRDPVKRFLSAFSNRVEHHRELSLEYISKRHSHLVGEIGVFDPTLEQFISNLHVYMKVNTISHHFKPMVSFLDGSDLSGFNMIFPIEKLSDLQIELGRLLNTNIPFEHGQKGGRKIAISDLTKDQVGFLLDFYSEDYKVLKDYYNSDDVWEAWNRGF